MTWLVLGVWALGYAWGFRLMLTEARRAYADHRSMLWHVYPDPNQIDGMGATLWAAGVLFVPLAWPLLWLGRLAWSLIVRPDANK